jgi:hypothetical protein
LYPFFLNDFKFKLSRALLFINTNSCRYVCIIYPVHCFDRYHPVPGDVLPKNKDRVSYRAGDRRAGIKHVPYNACYPGRSRAHPGDLSPAVVVRSGLAYFMDQHTGISDEIIKNYSELLDLEQEKMRHQFEVEEE